MSTIGQKLSAARKKAGLSVADASHETHIHANMIYGIEEDDFSIFASVSYARSFIRNYAEFLKVDLGNSLDALDTKMTQSLGDHELMGEMKKTIKKDRRFRLQRNPRSRRRMDKPANAPIFLNLILFSLIFAITVFYFLGYKTSSPAEAKSEIAKGLRKANPFATPTDESNDPAPPVSDEADASSPPPPAAPPTPVKTLADAIAPQPEPTPSSDEPITPRLQPVDLSKDKTPPQPATVSATNAAPSPPTAAADDDIKKPKVDWNVSENKPSPLARAGSQQSTEGIKTQVPSLQIEPDEAPILPIQSAELPAIQQALEQNPTLSRLPSEGTLSAEPATSSTTE